jgi:thiamine biosynthesis lipoprotein
MRTICLALIAAISLSDNALAQSACTPAIERTAYLMGTLLRVSACHADRDLAISAMEEGFAEVARLERMLSSWQASSEIGRLNAAPADARVSLSAELAGLLEEAAHWVAATQGAFDPAVGALIDAWGFRSHARVPSADQLEQALQATGWKHARVRANVIERGPSGWWIDTGGFGKGAALRALEAVLRARGVDDAVVDFGGQLVVMGEADVSIAHPTQRNAATSSIQVRDVSVATSSQSERFIESAGKRIGHILDPRTGQPVEAWGSVTVVAKDPLAADALSTALFVMGPHAALAWADQHPEVGVLVLETGQSEVRAAWSRAMTEWIQEN